MNKIIIILVILLARFYTNEACTSETVVNCSTSYPNSIYITVYGLTPTGSCTFVPMGPINLIFDPIMINAVWITLVNTGAVCRSDIPVFAQSLTTSMDYASLGQRIVILNLTPQYYRIVLIPAVCTNCAVIPFSPDMETRLSKISTHLYPINNNLNLLGQYCLYGGSLNPNYTGAGYQCNCGTIPAVYYGPNCQYMERVLGPTTQTFFNVFPNATNINIRFSLFSNGITGTQNILTIKNSNYQPVVQIFVIESTIYLSTSTNTSIPRPIDNQDWYDFNLVMNQTNVTLRVNVNSTNQTLPSFGDFRSYYLILNATQATTSNQVCIKNLLVNSVIMDLYTPNYSSCCINRCQCSVNETCACRPFVSVVGKRCFCKFGYNGIGCTAGSLQFSQMPTISTSASIVTNVNPLSQFDFGFQTISPNGTLVTLSLTTPVSTVQLQIVNTNLTLNASGRTVRTLNYNVSNGVKHNVTVTFTNYSLVMVLDGNYNYTSTLLNWYNITLYPSVSNIILGSFNLGPLVAPNVSPLNLPSTTCFSDLQLNSMTNPLSVPLGNTLNSSCSSGASCATLNTSCPPNSVCSSTQWQNLQCLCNANFTSVNNQCVYTACMVNPCLNGGNCTYNPMVNNYGCTCVNSYSGPTCNIALTPLWWIAVLIILFLLLVLIIILVICLCCIKSREPANSPKIGQVNENVVVYNEQAGETDYTGPPIDFKKMKNALGDTVDAGARAPPPPPFLSKKDEFDTNNKDLILDHPLEYGFEGYNSDNGSISSIGSISGGSELNLPAIEDPDLMQLFK